MAEWRTGIYVRVHGKISEFDNKKSIMAFQVRLITDFNEVRAPEAAVQACKQCQTLCCHLRMPACGWPDSVVYAHSYGPAGRGDARLRAQVTYHQLKCVFESAHLKKGAGIGNGGYGGGGVGGGGGVRRTPLSVAVLLRLLELPGSCGLQGRMWLLRLPLYCSMTRE